MPYLKLQEMDSNRRAFARFTAWMCLVAPTAVAVSILSQQGQAYRLSALAVFMLSGALALWLLRRKRDEAAFGVLCYGPWLATMIALSYSGGLYGNAALALPVVIMFSAWLAGIRAMLFLGGATIVALFGYAFLEMGGLLPVRAVTPILQRAFIMSVIVLTATALGYYAARTLAGQLAALRSTGERFASVFAASPVPIALSSLAEGRFVDVNPAFEQTFGWTRAELLGRSALDIGIWPSPEERQRWTAELEASHHVRNFETVQLTKAGEPLTILMSAETIELEGLPHIISFAHDETQRRRAEDAKRAALERFEAIFQHTPNVAIQGFDVRGTVLHWNRASETLYGIPAGEALGRPVQSLLHTPETAREFESVLAAICASGQPSAPGEWPIPLRDGREIWVLSTMFPVASDGLVAEIFCMDVDITELKQANESVHRLNVELEARVAARTAELAELNRELESFSYSVSHDLRAPLRSIEGFGRLLEEDYADRLDATGRDYIGRMARSARRLAQLIDDLLELTRIDRAEIRPADVDLSALAGEIVDELRQGAPQRQVRVDIAPGVHAQGDPQLLRVALQNLLENAWKYSARKADAHIAFGCIDAAGERIYHVRDNGAGFDMAYAGKLFAPFQRLHSPHEFEGSGVGLASVSRVIKRHHGRLWAEGAVDRGAAFYFTLG